MRNCHDMKPCKTAAVKIEKSKIIGEIRALCQKGVLYSKQTADILHSSLESFQA